MTPPDPTPSEEPAAPLSDAQVGLLAQVLDLLIPARREADLPGAGALGLASRIVDVCRESPEFLPVVVQGLSTLEALARERSPGGLESLDLAERAALLSELTLREPGFLPSLVFHTFVGYYLDDRVVRALGLEARPPYPKGYELETGDLGLLEPVRERDALYREV